MSVTQKINAVTVLSQYFQAVPERTEGRVSQSDTCTPLFIAALSTTVKRWKQSIGRG